MRKPAHGDVAEDREDDSVKEVDAETVLGDEPEASADRIG